VASESFFEVYDGDNRRPLDSEKWLMNVRLETTGEVEVGASEDAHHGEAEVAVAIARWRAAPAGQGNQHFYSLALNLHKMGMPADEIERTLEIEAAFGRSPSERRDQIPSIMSGLRKRRRAA
jgi:hypothetical protein